MHGRTLDGLYNRPHGPGPMESSFSLTYKFFSLSVGLIMKISSTTERSKDRLASTFDTQFQLRSEKKFLAACYASENHIEN